MIKRVWCPGTWRHDPAASSPGATINGAQLLSFEADLGTIETGKMADLVAVPDNFLQDITSMEHVAFVIKAGKIIRPLAAK